MKYIVFKNLKIKNFLSIGNEPVSVDFKKGLNIITGINRDKEDRRNGVGKSTIADGLYYAIFGITLRELKKEFISNNITQGVCEVQLEFDVTANDKTSTYTIIRSLSPSRLLLFKDGVDITRDSISNTNEHIEQVLSSSPEVFRNCVIMTLNDTIPFMSKSKTEKRKFIEQIFNLQIFSNMLSILRDNYNNTKKDLDIENARHNEVKSNLTTYNDQKINKSKEKEDKISNIKQKICSNISEVTRLKFQLDNVVKIDVTAKTIELEKFSKAQIKVEEISNQLRSDIAVLKTDIKNKNSQLSKMGTTEDVCPTCLRSLDTKDMSYIDCEKDKLSTCIKSMEDSLSLKAKGVNDIELKKTKIKNHINSLNKEIKEATAQETNLIAVKTRIEHLELLNTELTNSIENITADVTIFDALINEATTKYNNISTNIDKIKKTINLLDVVKFVLSEEGVKSFLVKKILQTFNARLAYYMKKLDSNSICIFNEYFEEEILNEKGKICLYNNFSGAERKAIDLACLFSFIDMRKYQGDVQYNVSIYDELFDTSLDQRGVELVIEILKERVALFNESIFIISHRKESIKSVDGDVIFLEKHNGITKRVLQVI